MTTPRRKELRRSYGFDEVAIVPGDVTINPEQTNIDFQIGDHTFGIPVLTASMDAIVDVNFAALMKIPVIGLNLDSHGTVDYNIEDSSGVKRSIITAQ